MQLLPIPIVIFFKIQVAVLTPRRVFCLPTC